MNTELMLQVANAIELEPEAFDLGGWVRDGANTICGSICCIGGHGIQMQPNLAFVKGEVPEFVPSVYDTEKKMMIGHAFDIARDLFQLSENHAMQLFASLNAWSMWLRELNYEMTNGTWQPLSHVTAKQAADVLRCLVDGTLTFHPEEDPDLS